MFVKTEERPQGEEQKALTMSQAIRVGCAYGPQCTGDWYSADGGSCALGAMYEGLFGKRKTDGNALVARFPELYREVRDFPMNVPFSGPLIGAIHRLNDWGWTRERIADWLESKGY